jgi:chemotaxis protein CheZ
MSDSWVDISAYAEPVAALASALAAGDEQAFRTALAVFDSVRDAEVVTGVRKVAGELQTALQRFEIDSRLINLAQQQVPNARRRLMHVVKLSADGVHRTMDLIEQCSPLADQLLREAEQLTRRLAAQPAPPPGDQVNVGFFVQRVAGTMATLRERLGEMRQAQGYQDLIGQIVRSVMGLVDELERALGELARIADFRESTISQKGDTLIRGRGPVVPGVEHGNAVAGQQDVDALLTQLGI